MHAGSNLGRLAATAAMMAITAGGFATLAAPVEAATGPFATLQSAW
jgi:hypothetical protein